jgi:hypothetical protein
VKVCHQEKLKKIPNSGELTKAVQTNCAGAHYTKIRKTIGYDTEKQKDIVRLEPAWRYVKIVPNVPVVQPISNPSVQIENNKVDEKLEKYVGIEEGRTKGTNGTKDPTVPVVPESDIEGYQQLVCYFCQKAVIGDDWVSDDFTGNKPSHKGCYAEKMGQLSQNYEEKGEDSS